MDELKGEPRSILFVDNPGGRVQLVAFADESWGIVRRGKTVCTWEADELTDCLRTFLDMAGRTGGGQFDELSPDASRDAALGNARLPSFHTERLN
jgi:hypothetical protein